MVVDALEGVLHLVRHLPLGHEVVLRDVLEAGVLPDLELPLLAPVAGAEAHRVGARDDLHAPGVAPGGAGGVVGDVDAVGLEVPGDPVHAGLGRDRGPAAPAEEGGEGAARSGVLVGGAEAPEDVALLVQELDRDLVVRVLGQVVVEDRAGGRGLGPAAPEAAEAPVHPVRRARLVEVGVGRGHPVVELTERGDVVQDPEGAALGGHDQIAPVHPEVRDRRDRKVELEALPVPSVVEGDEEAELGAGEEEPLALRVLPDDPGGEVRGDAVLAGGQEVPRLAVVGGLEDVRMPVVEAVLVSRHVRRPRRVLGEVDPVDRGQLGQAVRGDLRPVGRLAPADPDPAVVGAGPELALLMGRLDQGVDSVEDLDPGALTGDRHAAAVLMLRGVGGQVRADLLPAHAPVGGPVDDVRGVIDGARVVLGDEDRRVPLEAVLQVLGRRAELELGVDHHVPDLVGLGVPAVDDAAVAARIDEGRVVPVEGDRAGLAAADRVPELFGMRPAAVPGGDGDRGVVLLGPVDPVGELVVHLHRVELGGGLVVVGGPVFGVVHRDLPAAVVGHDHPVRVLRVDPEVVDVAVGHGDRLDRLPPVHRPVEPGVHGVEGVRVLRVGRQVNVVVRTLEETAVVVDEPEGLPPVVGAVEPALGLRRLHQHPDPVRVGRRDLDRGLPHGAGGQAAAELGPAVAAVLRLPDAALAAAGADDPRVALGLPGGGVEDPGIVRVHGQVHDAGAVGDEEDVLPALAPVGGPVDAPGGVVAEGVAQGGQVGHVRVLRMDLNVADLSSVLQPRELPAVAAVQGPVDAPARGDVAPDARRAGADVHHVRIGLRHGHGADGADVDLAVGDVRPVLARVVGLPDAAAGGARVPGVELGRVAGDRRGAAAPVGPDHPVIQTLEESGVVDDVRVALLGRPGSGDAEETEEPEGDTEPKAAAKRGRDHHLATPSMNRKRRRPGLNGQRRRAGSPGRRRLCAP